MALTESLRACNYTTADFQETSRRIHENIVARLRSRTPLRLLLTSLALSSLVLSHGPAEAQQRIRFPNAFQAPPTNPFGAPPVAGNGISATPWVRVTPGQGAVLGQQIQPFDPYVGTSQGLGAPLRGAPQVYPPPPAYPNVGSFPPSSAPPFGLPGGFSPALPPLTRPNTVPVFPSGVPAHSGLPPANFPPAIPPMYQPPYQQPPPLNGSVGPIPPQSVFPDGIQWGNERRWERLFQDTGVLYTYLYGDSGDELQMHEVEIFTSAVLKNFLHSPHDLRLTPGFAFHFLDGPAVPGGIDLPETLYGVYLNALWQPQLTPQFGADLNFRVGIYSDFDTITNDSLRFTGRGLGVLQMTPYAAFKLGIEYFDRVDLKILPAGGFYWEPDPQTRVDLYFPRPKISRYWTTWGNTELWWHVGGEYGGGSWTIDRVDTGASQRIDINDVRVFLGVDWNRLDRVDGIFEIGYVFEREIKVRGVPAEDLELDDTFMLRAGVKF